MTEAPGGIVTVRAGALRFRFAGLPPERASEFVKRYAPYTQEAGEPDVTIEVGEGESSYLHDDTGLLKLEERAGNDGMTLLSTNFEGHGPDLSGRARVFISPGVSESAYMTALENFFRWVASYRLLDSGGFLLHSSGVVKNGRAHIFFGNSGDGKSTIATFAEGRGARVLSDDLVIVSRREEGYAAEGAPFFGVMPQEKKEKDPYPVKGCYRIRKSGENRLGPLAAGQALALLIPSCLYINDPGVRNEKLIPVVMDFLSKVSCRELFFRKEDAFWDLI